MSSSAAAAAAASSSTSTSHQQRQQQHFGSHHAAVVSSPSSSTQQQHLQPHHASAASGGSSSSSGSSPRSTTHTHTQAQTQTQTPSRTSSRGNVRSSAAASRHGSFTSEAHELDAYGYGGGGGGGGYSTGPPSPIDEEARPFGSGSGGMGMGPSSLTLDASSGGERWKRRRSSAATEAAIGPGGAGGSYRYHGLKSKRTLLLGMRFGWVVLIIWGEVGEFFSSVSSCRFPDAQLTGVGGGKRRRRAGAGKSSGGAEAAADASSSSSAATPTHVLLLADPQIPHPTLSYPGRSAWLRKLTTWFIDLYMRKSWAVVTRLGRIDAIVIAGDMMDEGRADIDDDEYERYLRRFRSIFRLPDGVEMYTVPGNHDLGLGPVRLFSPKARQRYADSFSPPNALVSIANHTFVMLDAVSLVEEDYRRYAAEVQLGEWEGVRGGVIEFVKHLGRNKPPGPRILISHIPLARPEQSTCGPLRERGRILKGAGIGYQNLLGSETSRFLLANIDPAVVYSGDDHDYCEYHHPNGVREVTLKAFSMSMGIHRPGFQLLSLVPPAPVPEVKTSMIPQRTFADVPCLLPDQFDVYWRHYVPFAVLSLALLFYYNLKSAVDKHGGWAAASVSNVKHFLSPAPTPKGNSFDGGPSGGGKLGGQGARYPSRGDKPLKLTLPSRKSAQNLTGLYMTPNGGIGGGDHPSSSSGTARSRTPTLTPVRRIIKSAPASPDGTPRVPMRSLSGEGDAEAGYANGNGNGNGNGGGGLYANPNYSRSGGFDNGYLDPEAGRASFTEDPASYFLPLPEADHGGVPGNGSGGHSPSSLPSPVGNGYHTPGLYMSPRRPTSARRLTRPSDWASAAKAKDMTVVELMMLEQGPDVGRLRRWFGRERLRAITRWLGRRQGVVLITFKDAFKILWPTVIVWIGINAAFFL